MGYIFSILEIVLLALLSFDTLGFLVAQKKNNANVNISDYHRLCFTWVFFFALRAICPCGNGFFSNIVQMLTLFAKAYITIPMLGGTEKLYRSIVEENIFSQYIKGYIAALK
jgi:hypothetical protein